jgi:hypothetical protein
VCFFFTPKKNITAKSAVFIKTILVSFATFFFIHRRRHHHHRRRLSRDFPSTYIENFTMMCMRCVWKKASIKMKCMSYTKDINGRAIVIKTFFNRITFTLVVDAPISLV